MNHASHSKNAVHVLVTLLGAAAIVASTPASAVHGEPTVIASDAVKWGAGPQTLPSGAQVTVLAGNPANDGPFVIRLKFPAGYVVPPHRHSKDELVTVISGTFAIATGEKFDRAALKSLSPASFVQIPAGAPHYAAAEAETVVQINGAGPFDVTYVNPKDDPRAQ